MINGIKNPTIAAFVWFCFLALVKNQIILTSLILAHLYKSTESYYCHPDVGSARLSECMWGQRGLQVACQNLPIIFLLSNLWDFVKLK